MSFFLPPYRKLHIVILGGLAVILSYVLVYTPVQPWLGLANPDGWMFAGVHVPPNPLLVRLLDGKDLYGSGQNGSGNGANGGGSGNGNGSGSNSKTTDPARTANKKLPPATVISSTPDSIKSTFSKQLITVENGNYDTAAAIQDFIIFDIRPIDQYNQAHITGSLSVPIVALQHAVLDPSLKVVIYGQDPNDIKQAAAIIGQFGITKVYILTDSIDVLRKDGFKITP